MSNPVRIGAHIWPGEAPDYATWREAILRVEEMGVDAVFGYDHFHKPWVELTSEGPTLLDEQPDVNNFESWTALASWGELTSKVEIGLLVTGIGFRNPDLLADMARTVDHISNGRLILGLGAGWYEKDYSVYGYEYPTLKERMDVFAEGLERIKVRLAELQPPPIRDIPILIGGSGEKRTLPLVGRYADIWHSFLDLETFKEKNDLVREHAAAAGRDESKIRRSTAWPGSTEEADAYREEGVSLFTLEVKPDSAGYDLSGFEDLIAWRDDG